MRHTKSHTANRRSHHALKGARFVVCTKCGKEHLMHCVCANCGTYRGRMVVDTMKKTLKAAKKTEKKQDAGKPEGKKSKPESSEKKETASQKETKKK